MRIHLLAVGSRRPAWESRGFEEYARRMPRACALELVEIPVSRRTRATPVERAVEREGKRMLSAIPARARVVALDEQGQPWSTAQLAETLRGWLEDGRDLAVLVGGPDGLAPACRRRAEGCWSLSPLTLPHGLVRIIVAEQLYRAWSMIRHHPYHRGR